MRREKPHRAAFSGPESWFAPHFGSKNAQDWGCTLLSDRLLGVDHLARLSAVKPARPIAPADLIAGLAASNDARLQAALILLFLRQPSFNQYLPEALHQLSGEVAITLKLYYQAAVYLQDELQSELKASLADWQRLPDLFSAELGLPPSGNVSTNAGLHVLGKRHEELTGWAYN